MVHARSDGGTTKMWQWWQSSSPSESSLRTIIHGIQRRGVRYHGEEGAICASQVSFHLEKIGGLNYYLWKQRKILRTWCGLRASGGSWDKLYELWQSWEIACGKVFSGYLVSLGSTRSIKSGDINWENRWCLSPWEWMITPMGRILSERRISGGRVSASKTHIEPGKHTAAPQGKFRLRPGFVNKITLMHGSTHCVFFFYMSVAAFALQSNDQVVTTETQ